MASRSLTSDVDDHDSRVRLAEINSRIADTTRGDFKAFRSALESLMGHLQDFWCILKLDPAIKESLDALIMKNKMQCEVIDLLWENVISRYDRFLNLVTYLDHRSNESYLKMVQLLNYTNIRMVEGMKSVSEQNAKMTEEMKDLAKRNGDMTAEMKELAMKNADMTATMADLMRQNAEATTQMI